MRSLVSCALAAIAAIAAIAACRTESVIAPAPSAVDAGVVVEVVEVVDADADAAPTRLKGCPGETPTTYPWKPPVPKETAACTEANLSNLTTAIAREKLTAADIAAAIGPPCAKCAIGSVDDPSWRAVISGHEGYIGNVGGCAVLLGAKEICGEAIDRLSTCLIAGCDGCADRKAQDLCADALTTVDGACAASLVAVRKECPAATLSSAFDTNGECQSFVKTIRLFCGPARDGG